MVTNQEYTAKDYLAAFRRRRRNLYQLAGPILVITLMLALLLPNRYSSSALIDIDLEGSSVRTLEPIELTRFAEQYIAKLEERVFSAESIEPLAQDLRARFEPYKSVPDSELNVTLFDNIELSLITQPVLSQNFGREVDLISGFEVISAGRDPDSVYLIAQFISTKFLEADRLSRTERASTTTSFLREQMQQTEEEIVEYEQKMAAFKVENACCLPELMELNLAAIERAERDIETIQPRINTLESERRFYQSQIDEILQVSVSTDRLAELEKEYLRLVANYGADHPDVARVRREISAITESTPTVGDSATLASLRSQLESAEQRYSPEHPDVQRLKREIAALEKQQQDTRIRESRKNIDNPRFIQLRTQLNSVEAELEELRLRGPELRQKIEDYEARLRKAPQIESEYQALARDLTTARQNFDDLQRRVVIARQTEAFESTEFGARLSEVRSPSIPDQPSGPPRIAIMIIGAFLAVSFGIGAVLVAEATDSTLRGGRDLQVILDMVPLASIPVIANRHSQALHRRQIILMAALSLLVVGVLVAYYLARLN